MSSNNTLRTAISIDLDRPPECQKGVHNRWHPDIPAAASVAPLEEFYVECHDFTGGWVKNNDMTNDADEFDWNRDHCLSGPIRVETAEPGDVLCVEILDVQPFPNHPWGFSMVKPGIGPLDTDTNVFKAIWDFDGAETSSRHIPGLSFKGHPHCGTVGTAPSHDMLNQWTKRERALNEMDSNHGVPCAHMPSQEGAFVNGTDLSSELLERIKTEGARTTPARENGGSIDCKNLSCGAMIFLPVYVQGANLSIGDLHFSLGDGEPTCVIEMAGIMRLRCSIIKDEKLKINGPVVLLGKLDILYQQQLVFYGLLIDKDRAQLKNDATAAYIHVANRAIAWLSKLNYSHAQAIIILSSTPVLTRILAVANKPTVNVSVGIPIEIFSSDIIIADPLLKYARTKIMAPPPLSLNFRGIQSRLQAGWKRLSCSQR